MKTTITPPNSRTLLLTLLLALLALPTCLWADNEQAYVRTSDDGKTLTFRYDGDKQESDYAIDEYVNFIDDKELKDFPKVPAWCQYKKGQTVTKVVFDESFANAHPVNCSYWFFYLASLADIENMQYLNTSEVTDMSAMFCYCSSLTKLDLSHFDTSKVTNMDDMFAKCSKLTQLDLSKFNTENVTDMQTMFYSCSSLTELNITSFDTSKVTNMNSLFSSCGSLTTLNLSNFNTENVTDMQCMFSNCSDLTALDLSSFNTSKVTNMYYMFGFCIDLAELNLSSFNTSQVTNMSYMFYKCNDLKELDLSNFNTENVTDMERMFSDCSTLTKLDISNFNTAKVTSMWLQFYCCSSLKELDLYGFDTSASENCMSMFGSCSSLEKIYVGDNFKVSDSSDVSGSMFEGCTSLPNFDKSKVGGTMANYTTGYLLKKFGSIGDDILSGKTATLTIADLQLSDDKPFVLYESCKATKASYSRSMTSKWGTLCLPYAIDAAENTTCSFYEFEGIYNNSIIIKEIESGTIAAGTPVLVKKNEGLDEISFTATDVDLATAPVTSETNDHLVGTFSGVALKDDANSYFIAKDHFYRVSDYSTNNGVKVNPFRAYLQSTSFSRAPMLQIDAETTGIDTTMTLVDSLNDSTAECFDINGHRIAGVQKGLNIVRLGNGKTMKVLVK